MDFKQLFEANAVDVIQPDLSHAGGITEVQKIASMADAYDVSLAPHCPLGPIALAACIQLNAAAPNAITQEQSLDIHYNRTADVLDYLADPEVFTFDEGYVTPPDDPGIGITVDEDIVRERAGVDWDGTVGRYRPVWRRDDGSVAEW